jgi:putative oxidoreductase
MSAFNPFFSLGGRVLMALLFLLGGLGKFGNLAGTSAYMESAGIPGFLALPAAAFELVAGLLIVIGFQTRLVAVVLSGFCVVTAIIFHTNFAEQVQLVMFLKNLGLAGGFLLLARDGAGAFSMDSRRGA